jgi:hypothetical protein
VLQIRTIFDRIRISKGYNHVLIDPVSDSEPEPDPALDVKPDPAPNAERDLDPAP